MALLARIYFNGVFGALGGLLGWMLFGIFGDRTGSPDTSPTVQMFLGGALIGGLIGYFVVSVEAIRDRSPVRFCRLASYGVILGAVGGALGMYLGDEVNFRIIGWLGASHERTAGIAYVLLTMFIRGLGWMLLGITVGMSEGIAARSLGKFSYGTLGGAIGGLVGGALFGLFYLKSIEHAGNTAIWGALGLIILGACIGSFSALVQGVFQPASLKVLRGWQEGREYPLDRSSNHLGRDEHADIALFRDMKVEKRHVIIQREANHYVLVNNHAPPEYTRVNGETVAHVHDLHDGDRIELGNIILRFQLRAARRATARQKVNK